MAPDTSQTRPKQTMDFYKQHILSEKTPPSAENEEEGNISGHLHRSGSDLDGNDLERDYFQTRENFQRTSLRYLGGMHSSYNEKILARYRANGKPVSISPAATAVSASATPTTTMTMSTSSSITTASTPLHHAPPLAQKSITNQPPQKMLNENKPQSMRRVGLHRSNSNLEMDSVEYSDDDIPALAVSSRREYGSTSSLDLLHKSHEGFFAMLRDFRSGNSDQRSPAPPKIHEVLRGKAICEENSPSGLKSGGILTDKDADIGQSPKFKSKFKHKDRKMRAKSITGEAGSGIFRKLRGSKIDGTEINLKSEAGSENSDGRNEERIQRKAFVHFDCQSISVNLCELIERKNFSTERKNTTTGASAASVSRNSYVDNTDQLSYVDEGDNKSNSLVLNCPFFRNELGGEENRNISLCKFTAQKRNRQASEKEVEEKERIHRNPMCCGISVLDTSSSPSGQVLASFVKVKNHVIEYVDHGAQYYRYYFYGLEHQNYFGIDENLGPIAVSIKREKTDHRDNVSSKAEFSPNQYRIIFRTSELATHRGSILEDAIPSSSRLSSSRGVSYKDVLEYVLPEVNLSCLKQAISGQKTADQLVKLDEQGITNSYKVGIMYCKAEQSTEEEMYNNEMHGPAFEEFLECIGTRVRLKGFEKYRGQLDNKMDSTGTHSIYTTFNNYEIMFHVSTLLPFTPSNKQQLLRKRHIGNDIVSIVFQEPGALPFTPKSVRSHFQHVFIIVRVHNPNTPDVSYSVAVSRCKDVPPFGPPIPEIHFKKGHEFTDFLFAKVINGENAAHRSEKFKAMAARTHQEYLRDLATNYVTTTALDSTSKLSKFTLGSGRKKEKSKVKVIPDLYAKGATVFYVKIEDHGLCKEIDCFLGIAAEMIVLIEETTKDVIFTIPCSSILGWTAFTKSLKVYHNQGDCILMKPSSGESDEVHEIVSRLSTVTRGCQTQEMTLRRNDLGQLGFHIQAEGIVTEVEHYGFAWEAGIRKGTRLVEICKIATVTLSHEQIVDLLRTSSAVKVVAIRPDADGNPRSDVRSSPSQIGTISLDKNKESKQDKNNSSEMTSSLVKSNELNERRWSGDNLSKHQNKELNGSQNGGDSHLGKDNLANMKPHIQISKLVQHFESNCKDDLSGTGSFSSSSNSSIHTSFSDNTSNKLTYLNSPLNIGPVQASTPAVSAASSSSSSNNPSLMSKRPFVSGTGDYISPGTPQSGNISLELMKQSQNTKYLLQQQQAAKRKNSAPDHVFNNSSSLSQISDLSLSSGGSHHGSNKSSENFMQSSCREEMFSSCGITRKKNDLSANTKGWTDAIYKKVASDSSPHNSSSGSSSPQSSNKNLSGRSSEESLNSRSRSGGSYSTHSAPVALPVVPAHHMSKSIHGLSSSGKMTGGAATVNLQEELLRLINFDNIGSLHEDLDRSSEKYGLLARSGRLQRTMSDESLSSNKSATATPIANKDAFGASDAFLKKIPPIRSSPNAAAAKSEDGSKINKLSPRVMGDKTASPPTISRRKFVPPPPSSRIPLVDSTASLEWSNLVNVATKAIEGNQMSSSLHQSEQGMKHQKVTNEMPAFPTREKYSIQRAAVYNPQQTIKELEQKVQQLCENLEMEKQKNFLCENELSKLRAENQRLQEESQSAAAELRRFTEWFFNIVDRNWTQHSPTGLSQLMQAGFPEKNIDQP